MSIRQHNLGSIVKPGFNALGAQTSSYTYYLYGWGSNPQGQLGLGNRTSYSSPKQVGSLSDWTVTTGGATFTAAIKTDGTLWSWGSQGTYGELGLGNINAYSSPKQVGSLTNWLNVAAGYYHVLATKTDGTLWSWGYNFNGQLGLGNATRYSSPKQVGSLTAWSKVSANQYSSIALKTDGTIWSWGYGGYGTLGLGNTANYSSPKQIGLLTNWLNIAGCAGGYHVLATKTDGTLWTWGLNNSGQLGLGNITYYSSPKQIGALTTWSSSDVGGSFSVVVKTDGTVWSWGNNNNAQLGLGNLTSYSSPKQVGSLTTWLKISCGNFHTTSVKTDGTLWAWGYNAQGQLGQGNTTDRSSPIQIGALTTWGNVSNHVYSSFASLF